MRSTVNGGQKLRLGVLGSGKGSNMLAIAEACADGKIYAEIALVLSDVAEAGILQHATSFNAPCEFVSPGKFRTKLDEVAEPLYIQKLRDAQVDLIVLAGFMRILKGDFLRAFSQRVVNIHPSLLPAFPGLEAWRQALEYGVKVTGCTVHLVDQGIDSGPILAQETVPVLQDDTPESLHERIQRCERTLYPAVIGAWAAGRISVVGRRVVWQGDEPGRR
ncbi:MAG TPA: phosphoribosylglycinamide formyltransferase [Verrucomicrobiae bacterium]|jgi:phosphoribosylglycinamide formyltransferase-1